MALPWFIYEVKRSKDLTCIFVFYFNNIFIVYKTIKYPGIILIYMNIYNLKKIDKIS
jgi:hypothetical protein